MRPIAISFVTRYQTARIFDRKPPTSKGARLHHPVLMHWLGPPGLQVWSALVELGGDATVREVVSRTGLSDYRVRRTLRQLHAAGVVTVAGQALKVYRLKADAEAIILAFEQAYDALALQETHDRCHVG